VPGGPLVSAELVGSRPDRLRPRQRVFDRTGGLHAAGPHEPVTISVTMRTPGHDFELAAGFLHGEGVIAGADDLDPLEEFNVVTVEATAPPLALPDLRAVSSACGVCGKETIADVLAGARPSSPGLPVSLEVVRGLPERLRRQQTGFDRTGGLHAAGLFGLDGTLVVVREDVGRHNAVDKVVGSVLLGGGSAMPPVLVLSGRVGFELVQKAVVSGIGWVVAVGAPSSLAVDLARETGVGLVGFTRPDRCVVYAGDDRLGV
jgi:FdhD protein